MLDSEETAANVDYVRAEFERHAGALRRAAHEAARGRRRAALSERIAGNLRRLAGRLGAEGDRGARRAARSRSQREALLKLLRPRTAPTRCSTSSRRDGRGLQRPAATRIRRTRRGEPQGIDDLRREVVELKERDARRRAGRRGRGGRDPQGPQLRGARPRRDRAHRRGPGRRSAPHRRRAAEGGRQEGRHGRRDRRRRSAAPLASVRLRGEEQAAVEERRLVGAQRLHARARRRLLACWSWRARTRCPPASRSSPSTRATRSSPCSIARSRIRSRCGSSTATCGLACWRPATATLQVDAAGVRDAAEEAQAALKRAQSGAQVADRHHQWRRGGAYRARTA